MDDFLGPLSHRSVSAEAALRSPMVSRELAGVAKKMAGVGLQGWMDSRVSFILHLETNYYPNWWNCMRRHGGPTASPRL